MMKGIPLDWKCTNFLGQESIFTLNARWFK
jgi:hypothetical protein